MDLKGYYLQEKFLSLFQRVQVILRWCLYWTSPVSVSGNTTLAQKEAARRGQLTGVVLLILLVFMIAYTPMMLSTPPIIFLIYVSLFVFMGLAAFANHRGKSNRAGFIVMMSIEFIAVALILFYPTGFDIQALPMYDFLIIPTTLAVSLLPPYSVFPLAIGNITLTVLTAIFLPKSHALQVLFATQPTAVVGIPIVIQCLCSAITFLWVHGSLQALKEANRADMLDRLYQEQAQVAETDAITGLPNQRALMNVLRDTINCSQESQEAFTLLFVDLDHFKQINDTWGHLAGDAVLRHAGTCLQTAFASCGFVGRYGGEEFAIVLREGDLQRASEMAEYARHLLASSSCQWNAGAETIAINATGSIGVALYGLHGTDAATLLEQADQAMYQAKMQGRNRVCIATEGEPKRALKKVVQREGASETAVVQALAAASQLHDRETGDHAQRMIMLVDILANRLGCSPDQRRSLRQAAILHDIGKIGVPEQILRKPGSLTTEEWEIMRTHPELGAQILRQVGGGLDHLAPLVEAHHERWDGMGYPKNLLHDEIPLGSRILSVVDSYDAMTSNRPYRQSLSDEQACDELLRCAGVHYDPLVVHAFLEILHLQKEHNILNSERTVA